MKRTEDSGLRTEKDLGRALNQNPALTNQESIGQTLSDSIESE